MIQTETTTNRLAQAFKAAGCAMTLTAGVLLVLVFAAPKPVSDAVRMPPVVAVSVDVSAWFMFLLARLGLLRGMSRPMRTSISQPPPYLCPTCGYMLRGVTGICCPECGTVRPAPIEGDEPPSPSPPLARD